MEIDELLKHFKTHQEELLTSLLEGSCKPLSKEKTKIFKLTQVKYLRYTFYRVKGKCRLRALKV